MLELAKKSQRDEFKLVLASGSARRKWILENAGFKFTCVTSNFPEDLDKALFEGAVEYVRATCLGKIEALSEPSGSEIQVACDTVLVTPEGKILEKPGDWDEAISMLKGMLGKRIRAVSVVHLRAAGRKIQSFSEESYFSLRSAEEIDDADLAGYLESVNYRDLAGGLAVQSCGMVLFESIQGCYYNVMGFPISKFYQELKKFINSH